MLDLKAIAAGRGWDIPAEQLERLAPVWQALDDDLQHLLASVPDAPDSAIQFDVPEGEA